MIETAIYVLIGALASALLFLLTLPAISRRANRLAERRARLTAPQSAEEARAERDALRGRHAVEMALVERRAEEAREGSAAAQIALGRQATEIVQRDAVIAERSREIALQRAELSTLSAALQARETEVAAHEIALFDYAGQREAAERKLAEATAASKQRQREFDDARARLEAQIASLSRELSEVGREADAALASARARAADLERQLSASEAAAERALDEIAALKARPVPVAAATLAPGDNIGDADDRLAEAAARENELTARVQMLAAARSEAESAARAARAERDALARELAQLRETLGANDAKSSATPEADAQLRLAIARLGRELVAARTKAMSEAALVTEP